MRTNLTDGILKKNPQDAEALVLKGQVQLRQHKAEDASSTACNPPLKTAPENALAHYQLGMAFAEKGNQQQAESEWREAVRLRPNLSEAWLALSRSAAQKADWQNLEESSNQLKKYAPKAIDGYLLHATARMNQGDALGAEADLMSLQRIAPQSPLYFLKMGQLRLAQNRIPDAESMFHQALSRDPNSLEAIQGLVRSRRSKEQACRRAQSCSGADQAKCDEPRTFLAAGGTSTPGETAPTGAGFAKQGPRAGQK